MFDFCKINDSTTIQRIHFLGKFIGTHKLCFYKVHIQCSGRIQPLYNLNFAPLSLGGGAVALFLLAYPAMAIASIPIAAITTRNTMGQWLGITPADPEADRSGGPPLSPRGKMEVL